MFFTKNKPKKLSLLEKEFYNKKRTLEDKFSISARFASISEEMTVDFEIGKEWALLDQCSSGHIEFRCFTSKATELIKGSKRKTKSAQNFWKKGAFIKSHYHTEADEYIYLVHGILEILIKNDDGSVTETIYDSDSNQPIIIPMGTVHFVKCLTQASFVVKFVFK